MDIGLNRTLNFFNSLVNNKKSTVDLHRRVRNQRSFFIPKIKKGGHETGPVKIYAQICLQAPAE